MQDRQTWDSLVGPPKAFRLQRPEPASPREVSLAERQLFRRLCFFRFLRLQMALGDRIFWRERLRV